MDLSHCRVLVKEGKEQMGKVAKGLRNWEFGMPACA